MPDKNGLSDKQMQYAILNDVYESYSADTKEKINNLKIDIEYEKLFTEMRQYQGKDRMSVDMFRSIGIIYYSDSLLRRYGEAKSKYEDNQNELSKEALAQEDRNKVQELQREQARTKVREERGWER
jgi:hypothetical protein